MADLEKTRKNLEGRGFRVHRFASGAEAGEFLVQTLHGTSIGIGGSVTIDTLGVYDRLCGSNEVFWHWKNHAPETRERAGKAETYLCSANGVSENGEIVNIDGFGNRLAATLYGPRKVYMIVGENKLADTLDAAMDRIKNVSCPRNAKRLNLKTPCAVLGRCTDCSSPDRMCHATLILDRKPNAHPMEILLVAQELGY